MQILTKFSPLLFSLGMMLCLSTSCSEKEVVPTQAPMQIAHLSNGDDVGFAAIRAAFQERNQGYDLHYFSQVQTIGPEDIHRLAFMQEGGGTANLNGDTSKVSVGDIIYLKPGKSLKVDSLVSLLVFSIPEAIPENIPDFIRPDWDLNITDTPGGCATETNAYRRILLTWLGKNGPYLYHGLNAHRVRIMNSFTHYHPLEGGFDEFYLVQMAQPKAKIITSERVDLITNPAKVQPEDLNSLLKTTPLSVGDLVYLPRGVAHRGLDGVLAQVITVPGFIPGSEIGLDHHLKAINDRLEVEGKEATALTFHEEAAKTAVVK